MKWMISRLLADRRGATAIEYGLIAALLSAAL
ncbi:Flp family type IVb pilin, partial [Hoeflea sp.]